MRNHRKFVLSLMVAGTLAAASTGFSQPPDTEALPPGVAQATAADISDWALSGVVWSDANLTRKLALVALRSTNNESVKTQLNDVVMQSSQIISALEKFGWRQVKQQTSADERTSAGDSARSGPSQSRKEIAVPSESEAEEAIAKFSGKATPDAPDAPDRRDRTAPTASDPLAIGTPSGSIDPGIAEPARLQGANAETGSREAPKKPASDRISSREGWTLSATLPYSTDSVYDQDDYDPDVDYFVENPRGSDSSTAAPVTRPRVTPRANPDRELRGAERPSPADRSPRISRVHMQNFTTQDEPNPADARWVQFRLDANQWRYSVTDPADAIEATRDALRQLQSSAMIAGRSPQNPELREILKPIMSMGH